MDISSITAGTALHRAWTTHAARAQAPLAAQRSDVSKAEVATPPRPTPQRSQLPPLDVQIETRPDGGRQLTILDKTTGQVYCQLPPERVVQVLEAAMRRMQHGEDG